MNLARRQPIALNGLSDLTLHVAAAAVVMAVVTGLRSPLLGASAARGAGTLQ